MATRGSALARWQAEYAAARLRAAGADDVALEVVATAGDRRTDLPIWELGGQGVFVKEVQQAVLDERADLAVHSAKDLPSETPPGLLLAAVPVRADPRDALVGSTLEALGKAATVATGSVRRRAQLAWARPDLQFVGVRGNIATRLQRVPAGGALVVAAAALDRLGLAEHAAERLDTCTMLPQVGQGALALECREDDEVTRGLLEAIDDADAHDALRAERAFLACLGGGCDLPVGAFAHFDSLDEIVIEGIVASADGGSLGRDLLRGGRGEAESLGAVLAERLLAVAGEESSSAGDPGRAPRGTRGRKGGGSRAQRRGWPAGGSE